MMPAISPKAKANQRKRSRESYAWYKSKGICPRCKTAWCDAGKVYCPDCAKKNYDALKRLGSNSQRCKDRRERLKAQGLCVNCGNPAVKGRVLCSICARKNSEAQQVRKMKQRIEREAQKVRENAKPRV